MGRAKRRLTIARFLDAIEGSGGIKALVCARVPCDFKTFERWASRHATIAAAFETECNATIGLAKSVVVGNIELARELQETERIQVDSSDAKWFLAKYDEAALPPRVEVSVTLDTWRKRADERLERVKELHSSGRELE